MRVCILIATLALGLLCSACGGGGGGGIPVDDGLSTLNFQLSSDPGSVPAASEVEGFRVDLTHPDFVNIANGAPAGFEVVDAVLLQPETSSGFSGNIQFTSS